MDLHEKSDQQRFEKVAKECRLKVLDLIFKAQVSHIGSNFSCIDILTVLFDKIDLDRDKFVMSKGWCAASLYYFLWKKGRLSIEDLDSFCMEGSKFIGLAEPVHPDIHFAGGSMGMGFPAAVGYALSKKLKNEPGMIYCLASDGEMQIGTIWESVLIAAKFKLDNLVLIVDYNGLQAMGKVEDILPIRPLEKKFRSFGWEVRMGGGHDYARIGLGIQPVLHGFPTVFIADTIKGKGVSFMEGVNLYHYKQLSKTEFEQAKKELEK